MKEHPILFNAPMVQAILDGRKTQTRRIVKWKKNISSPEVGFTAFCDDRQFAVRGWHENGQYGESLFKMPYKKGDLLWVKETFAQNVTSRIQTNPITLYKANFLGEEKEITEYMKKFGHKWKPSIHMPKAAARIWLQIEEIRAERLKDISEEDAKAEGTPESYCIHTPYNEYWAYGFNCLWNEINGIESWDRNPWVWVITFKVISTNRQAYHIWSEAKSRAESPERNDSGRSDSGTVSQ